MKMPTGDLMIMFPRIKPTAGTEITCSITATQYKSFVASAASNHGQLFETTKEVVGQWWANAKKLEYKIETPNPVGAPLVSLFYFHQYAYEEPGGALDVRNDSKYSFPRASYVDGVSFPQLGIGSDFTYYDPSSFLTLALPTLFMWMGAWIYYHPHGNSSDIHEHTLSTSEWVRVRKTSAGALITTETITILETFH